MRIQNIFWGGGHLLRANRGVSALSSRATIKTSTPQQGIICLSALAFLGALFLFPSIPDTAQAEEAGSSASLTIQPSIAVTIPNEITFDVYPTATGAFSSGTAELSVTTNNETGYSLYLATTNGQSTLNSINPDISATVQPIDGGASGITSSAFESNTWGYNLGQAAPDDSTTYQAVPTSKPSAPQVSTDRPTTNTGSSAGAADTYNLTFAAKVDTSLPSGTYTNTVAVSVVANPAYVAAFDGISNMQEMTTDICQRAAINDTARLTDTRDGKRYWVTKLADGNCWMTQNLDFDIPADGITTENGLADQTDFAYGYTWQSGSPYYAPQATKGPDATYDISNTGTNSWNPGLYVVSAPTDPSQECSGWASLAPCSSSTSIVDVSSYTAAHYIWPSTEIVDVVDESAGVYDAHYLIGNYYQWNAATAGTGNVITTGTATSSVCPKGWHLPTQSGDTSFYNLISHYPGLVENLSSATATGTTTTAIAGSPLYLYGGGGVINSASYHSVGSQGAWWSASPAPVNSHAYALTLEEDLTQIIPSDTKSVRSYGYTIRCVAPSA